MKVEETVCQLKSRILEKGNLKLIREPELEGLTEFEVFDPELIDRINITQSGESGRRTYKYTIIL